MRLLSVEIQGFKSFANLTHLTFGSGVTGVIGPNGSGKSNVAEAIRWVLGEQSMKMLRGKERSDVIYSGNANHASRARVTLTFDNESGRFPIPAAEISISRTLSRNGESEYAINSEPVRLIDLQQMLAEAGIGTKSYTVISQGIIDKYLTANPEGRI
ncbi:MAG TPA: AAA family ATPase [Candidatus Andersenbacteria bacterium]|nr:AAA family ATPase [Candidatus Andersenbacteria bacterium]